jgi:hypothetical protein
MFCPNCGANNNTEQKFCRACGLNLEKTAEFLTEQFPELGKKELLRQQILLEKFGALAFCGFGVVVVMGVGAIIYSIITKMIIPGPGDKVFTGILLLAFMVFATLLLAYVFFSKIFKEKKQKTSPNIEKELAAPANTGKMLDEGYLQPVSSVTEHSTELLYDTARTKKFD